MMKLQILFSGKTKKNIINLSSAELAQRVVKINQCLYFAGSLMAFKRSCICLCYSWMLTLGMLGKKFSR